MKWSGHVARMRIKCLYEKLWRLLEIFRRRCKDNIKMGLNGIARGLDATELLRIWLMNFWVAEKEVNFLTASVTISFSTVTILHRISEYKYLFFITKTSL